MLHYARIKIKFSMKWIHGIVFVVLRSNLKISRRTLFTEKLTKQIDMVEVDVVEAHDK